MSARFIATNSSYIANAAPLVSTYPITVGMWVNLRLAANRNRTLWGLSDTGTSTNYLRFGMNTFENIFIAANAGVTETVISMVTDLTALQWNFVLARFISPSIRRIACVHYSGLTQQAEELTTISPAGLDLMTLGVLSTSNGPSTSAFTSANWDGRIGEFWYANSDIKLSNAFLTDYELKKLAYEGPFAFPNFTDKIIEYRGFRKSLISDQDQSDDVYWGGFGRPRWTNNEVTLGAHVPTTSWYPQGYPSRAYDLLRRDVFQPGAAPAAELARLPYPVRLDGVGYGGIFPGNRLHQKEP